MPQKQVSKGSAVTESKRPSNLTLPGLSTWTAIGRVRTSVNAKILTTLYNLTSLHAVDFKDPLRFLQKSLRRRPRDYFFVAPRGAGTTLSQFLGNPDALRAELKKVWDKAFIAIKLPIWVRYLYRTILPLTSSNFLFRFSSPSLFVKCSNRTRRHPFWCRFGFDNAKTEAYAKRSKSSGGEWLRRQQLAAYRIIPRSQSPTLQN